MREKLNLNKTDTFFIILLIVTAIIAFFLGKISEQYKNSLVHKGEIQLIDNQSENQLDNIQLVASSQGTKYHLPWCSGALSMKEENKIFFEDKEEAETAGYTPAKNCEGL